MQMLLVLFLFFGLVKCEPDPPFNSTEYDSEPIHYTNVTINTVGNTVTGLIDNLNLYLHKLIDKKDNDGESGGFSFGIQGPKEDTWFIIIIALIILLLLISIFTCCLIFILLLCWQRRSQQQKKQKEIEKLPSSVVSQTPQQLIIPPPKNNILLKSTAPTPLLHRQPEIPHSPIAPDPEVVGFRPIQSPEFKKNAKSQNSEKPKQKRSTSEDPKLKKTVDAQKRTDTSSNLSSSATSSPASAKGKTPRQAKNGAISNKAIQTDLDTSDEEEFQNRVRGNETMPGRNIPSPRTELLV